MRRFGGPIADADPPAERSWVGALARGLSRKCPRCGKGRLFDGYIRVAKVCEACGLDLSGHRADDAPPYLTVLIVGHVAIPAALAVKQLLDPPLALQFAFWLPVVCAGAFWLLPLMKGGLVGIQWANRMHGFSRDQEEDPPAQS